MSNKNLNDREILQRFMEKKSRTRKKKKEKNVFEMSKLPEEWQKKPSGLKGKELGLWHRKRQILMKEIQLLDIQNNQPKKNGAASPKKKKMSEKDRKAAKKAELEAKLAKRNAAKERNQYFNITFDSSRETMIENYLQNSENERPSFLIPLHEYHKRLKRNHQPQTDDACEIFQGVQAFENEDLESTMKQAHELYETFPYNLSSDLTVDQIQAFLKNETDVQCLENKSPNKSPNKRSIQNTSNWIENDTLDAMDKYKHLEESSFKRNFLSVLSSNIQENLRKAAKKKEMKRIPQSDEQFYQAFRMKESSAKYKQLLKERQRLPAFQMEKTILELINNNQIVLISGETGCGKTTQVAQFILNEAILNHNGSLCNIVCTQPRRISAISVAQRVADERAEQLGKESIGYQIRLEKKIGRQRGSILYCTTGILLQFMQGDPALSKYSHIILDEIHERDILCDFILTILRDIAVKRPNLKIILMSATLNAERFSNFFNNCPSLNIPGYTFPVEELYLEDVLFLTKFVFPPTKKMRNQDDNDFKRNVLPYIESLKNKYPDHVIQGLSNPESEKVNADLIVALVKYICTCQGKGAILIFVPGWDDINTILRKMNEDGFFERSSYLIIPLHSMLSTASQKSVFDRPRDKQRKIVIATNIAETSITINDIVYVIDCGKIKIKNYDVINNISTLKPEFVSLANARQRRGRAGRVQSGVCYHLFSRGREAVLADYPLPEMLRTRLEEVILNIKLLQLGKAAPFLEKVMDPPNPRAVTLAIELLIQLNALDENENLTPLGFHLAKLPMDPQIGKMLLMAVTMSCLNPILSIAAALSSKDPFQVPLNEERILKERKLELDMGHKSDHLILAEVMDRWEAKEKGGRVKNFCDYYYLNRHTLRQLREQKYLFAQYLVDMGFLNNTDFKEKHLNVNSDNIALVKAVICSGLFPNVAVIQRGLNETKNKGKPMLRTSEDGRVALHPRSVNTVQKTHFESHFFVYHEKLLSSCIFIHDTTMISSLPLLIFCYNFYLCEGKRVRIELNGDLRFICNKKTAHYITELKLRLNWLLEYKLSHPGQIRWKDESSEIELLKTLTELFKSENDSVMRVKDDSSDE